MSTTMTPAEVREAIDAAYSWIDDRHDGRADSILGGLGSASAAVAALVAERDALRSAPTAEAARRMSAAGAPAVEAERTAFEAWMAGHCWALSATWNGKQYVSDAEQGGGFCPRAMQTRMLWAAWRDRAALAGAGQ